MSHITTLDLIRHGEPVGGRKYRGKLDDPLSEKGWQQMWKAVGDCDDWQHIVTSPLLRCAEFADALGSRLQVPVMRDDRLMEGGAGEWEGRLHDEICADEPLRLFRFKRDPVRNAPQGGEGVLQVHARVGEAWRELLARERGRHALIVAHAGVIRMLLSHALGLPLENAYRINVGNAALSRIRVEHHGDEFLATLMFHDGRL